MNSETIRMHPKKEEWEWEGGRREGERGDRRGERRERGKGRKKREGLLQR